MSDEMTGSVKSEETCAYMGLYLKEPEKFDQVVEELISFSYLRQEGMWNTEGTEMNDGYDKFYNKEAARFKKLSANDNALAKVRIVFTALIQQLRLRRTQT